MWHILFMTLDQWMREHRKTDAALAAEAGISRPYLTRIRNRQRAPSLETALKLSEATGLPASAFAKLADA